MAGKWPERQFVGVKVGVRGLAWLDQIVLDEAGRVTDRDITRSHAIRAALVLSRRHEAEFRAILRDQS